MENLPTHPLQSPFWAEFRKKVGNKVVENKNFTMTIHTVPFLNLKIGAIIKGPRVNSKLIKDLKEIAKTESLIAIRIEPNVLKNQEDINFLKSINAKKGRRLFTPESFWIDLTKNEIDLLNSFNSKTRYNIKLAQKKGVIIKIDNSDKSFEKYLSLTKETAQRQGFYAHSETYHRLMWNTLKNKIAYLLVAKYQNEILSTWILFLYNDVLYYPYGASSNSHKDVMANNLMMWEAIKFGKNKNAKIFDLWGKEKGKGFTKFKEGYNPQVVEFIGTWDIAFSPLYYLFIALEKIRWFVLRIKSKIQKPNF